MFRTSIVVAFRRKLISITVVAAALLQQMALAEVSREEQARVTELWQPVPPVVTSGLNGAPPSDALILFDGRDLGELRSVDGGAVPWVVRDGTLTVLGGSGDIQSRRNFGDIQLHIEWRSPAQVQGDSQGRGNSGIKFMGRYEVQILDSFENPTYPNGQAASIYKQHIPLVNASRPPGEWQTYDIIFMAPRFGAGGRVAAPATVTVLHNGVLVQNHVVLLGTTEYIGQASYEQHGPAPIRLQDHGNPVSFRNIWVREL